MDLRYPIGKFEKPTTIGAQNLSDWMDTIAVFPAHIAKEVLPLSDEQLDTPYREGGWTVRQVVHHCADSHMNAVMRFKLALTEPNPIVKPYEEALWAQLPDSKIPVAPSLGIIKGLHERWSVLLRALDKDDLKRTYIHPEHGRPIPLDEVVGMYAWHCVHHLAHITTLKKNRGWV